MEPLNEESLAEHDRKIAEEQMKAEGRDESPDVEYESSASSVSSECLDDDEDEVITSEGTIKGWSVKDPERWAQNRLVQIHEDLLVFKDNGFITQDGVDNAVSWAKSMLYVVLRDPSAYCSEAMASGSFWAIKLCKIAFSRRPDGDGFKVSSRSQEVIDHAVERWSMENLHNVLLGDKSKVFKDVSKGGEYLTEVPSQAARKNKISVWITRGDQPRKRLDIRSLGDKSEQMKKTKTFFKIWGRAELNQDNPVDPRIVNLQPPATHKFQPANSARDKFSAHALASRDAMLGMKVAGKQIHGAKRAVMGPVRNSSIVPRVKKTGGLSMGSTERRAASPIPGINHDSDSEDLNPESNIANGMMPMARKKSDISRNGAVDEAEVVGAIDKPEVPSDNEEDIRQEKKDILQQMLSYSACAPKSESDDDSEEETGHHSTGPREEGAVTVSEHEFYKKLKQIRGISTSENDKNKIYATFEALSAQERGERLTQGQCRLIAWFDNLDPSSLKEGELKRMKPGPTAEQTLKRLQDAADKKRKEIHNARVKEAREEFKKAEAEEKERERLAKLKRKQEEEQAKEEKRQKREEAKEKKEQELEEAKKKKEQEKHEKAEAIIALVNAKLNAHVRKFRRQ